MLQINVMCTQLRLMRWGRALWIFLKASTVFGVSNNYCEEEKSLAKKPIKLEGAMEIY